MILLMKLSERDADVYAKLLELHFYRNGIIPNCGTSISFEAGSYQIMALQ